MNYYNLPRITVSESFASRFDSITETGRNGRRRNRDQVRSLFCDTFVLAWDTFVAKHHWIVLTGVDFESSHAKLRSSGVRFLCTAALAFAWSWFFWVEPSLFFLNDLSVTSPIIMLCRSNRQPAAPEMVARCWKISGSSLWWLEPSLRWWSCWVGFKALLVSAKSQDASLIVSHHCMICMTFPAVYRARLAKRVLPKRRRWSL